jgi:hypothetical protein
LVELMAILCKLTGHALCVACAKEILDRGYGRPIQAVDLIMLGKKLSELSTEELVALNSRLLSSGAVGAEQPPAEEAIH